MILFSDIDRTIVHPITLLPEGASGWQSVETFEERDITCMSVRGLALLERFSQEHAFVPVTTRSSAQIARITRVVDAAADGRLICCNGARVLQNGVDDPVWKELMDAERAQAATPEEAQAALDAVFGPAGDRHWILRWCDCEATFIYAICDLERVPAGTEAAAQAALSPLGWRAWLHGKKLYALPQCVTKERAAEYLRELLGHEHAETVGAGDSEMDRGLVEWAAQGWVPANSELSRGAAFSPHVRLGEKGHIAFTEEIIGSLLGE
jgi:hydroxymethylpyrimidine pyrophosphatase-like HAD family hydrolase